VAGSAGGAGSTGSTGLGKKQPFVLELMNWSSLESVNDFFFFCSFDVFPLGNIFMLKRAAT
jgi:hypothetical protein